MTFARGVRAGPDRGAEWQPAMRTSWATVMGIAKALGLGSWWDPREGQSGPRGSRGKEADRSSGAGEKCVFPHLCDGWPVMRFIPGSEAIVFFVCRSSCCWWLQPPRAEAGGPCCRLLQPPRRAGAVDPDLAGVAGLGRGGSGVAEPIGRLGTYGVGWHSHFRRGKLTVQGQAEGHRHLWLVSHSQGLWDGDGVAPASQGCRGFSALLTGRKDSVVSARALSAETPRATYLFGKCLPSTCCVTAAGSSTLTPWRRGQVMTRP